MSSSCSAESHIEWHIHLYDVEKLLYPWNLILNINSMDAIILLLPWCIAVSF